jgi:uncharacterized membrane protein YciS (DUF1049 family)
MRKILNFLALVLVIFAALVLIYNTSQTVELTFWNTADGQEASFMAFNFAAIGLILFTTGLIAGMLWVCGMYFELQGKMKKYKKEIEKKSIGADTSNSQIQVLENKIQVLEKALQDSLDK